MATPANPYVFAFNGWLFGGVDGGGVQVLSIEGLEDLPTLRTQDEGRGYADGMFTGRDFLNGRTITMVLQVMGAGAAAATQFQTYMANVRQYLLSQTTGTGVLQIYLPKVNPTSYTALGVQRVNARVRRRAVRIDPNYTYGRAEVTVEFFCPDPRIYADTATTSSLNPTGGNFRTYSANRTYNLAYNVAGSGTTSATVTNNGNYETWPVFTISGACTNPRITNVTTGQYLTFPAVTLGASDTLVVNTDLKTVTLNGGAARNLLGNGSQWFSLPAQTPTTVLYTVASGSGLCNLSYRDAYI
jgi:hypothetical protein